MRGGTLRHKVTIQERSTTRDTYGEPANTWTTFASGVWASIEPLSGRELIAAQVVQSEITHRVRLRYQAGITTAHRVLFGSRVFDIRVVRNLSEMDRELELLCTEGESGG